MISSGAIIFFLASSDLSPILGFITSTYDPLGTALAFTLASGILPFMS